MTDARKQFYDYFCEPTDDGMYVHFTSKILKDEDGGGVTLDDFIDTTLQAERERLVSEINKMSNCKRFQTNDFDSGYETAIDDIVNLINPPSNN